MYAVLEGIDCVGKSTQISALREISQALNSFLPNHNSSSDSIESNSLLIAKNPHLKQILQNLKHKNLAILKNASFSFEPGATALGAKIREILLQEKEPKEQNKIIGIFRKKENSKNNLDFCDLDSIENENLIESKSKISANAEALLFLADRAQHFSEIINPALQKNPSSLVLSDRSLISGIAYARANGGDFTQLKNLNLFASGGILPQKCVLLEISQNALQKRLSSKKLDKIESRGVCYLLSLQEFLLSTIKELEIPYLRVNAEAPKEKITEEILDFLCEDLPQNHENSANSSENSNTILCEKSNSLDSIKLEDLKAIGIA